MSKLLKELKVIKDDEGKTLATLKLPMFSINRATYAMTIVSKFKWVRVENGQCKDILIHRESKKPLVEFLAFKKNKNMKYWMIPSGRFKYRPDDLKPINISERMLKIYHGIFINSKIIFDESFDANDFGYDELIVENCHHCSEETSRVLDQMIGLEADTGRYSFTWLDIFSPLVYPPHRFILKKCAMHLNAYWTDLET